MDNYFYRKLIFAKSKSGGTSNYADLSNKPQINGVTLDGNKTSEDLGIEQGVTEEVLTQALAAESAAREKQDELLQGEIEGKIAAANIKAGNGINVSQEGNNVTINSTVQPKTYTAGTNIEITEDNVINNTIPYSDNNNLVVIGNIKFNYISEAGALIGKNLQISRNNGYGHVLIGNNAKGGDNSVSIGSFAGGISGVATVSIGANASATQSYAIAMGYQSNASNTNSIAFGRNATTDKDNQLVMGSTQAPINEMKVVTSDGDKYIATTDQTVPTGGTTGQVLMKNSDADYDFSWTSLADYDEVSF